MIQQEVENWRVFHGSVQSNYIKNIFSDLHFVVVNHADRLGLICSGFEMPFYDISTSITIQWG